MSTLTDNTENEGVKLHLQEADNLKKQWFSYVFESIQKLHDKIEINTAQLRKEKEELLKILMAYKEELNKTTQENSTKHREDLERLKNGVELTISTIEKQLNGIFLNNSELKHLIDNEVHGLKMEFMDKIETVVKIHIADDELKFKALSEALKTVGDESLVAKTRLGVYAVIISLIVTTFLGGTAVGLVALFKDAIKAFFMGA